MLVSRGPVPVVFFECVCSSDVELSIAPATPASEWTEITSPSAGTIPCNFVVLGVRTSVSGGGGGC